jgi:hypothetical protein
VLSQADIQALTTIRIKARSFTFDSRVREKAALILDLCDDMAADLDDGIERVPRTVPTLSECLAAQNGMLSYSGGGEMKTAVRENYRIEIYPPHPGNFGICFISSVTRTDEETVRMLEEMKSQIERHVDGVRRNSVNIVHDTTDYCEWCGSKWTEGDSPHNGGCCDKDCEVMDGIETAIVDANS